LKVLAALSNLLMSWYELRCRILLGAWPAHWGQTPPQVIEIQPLNRSNKFDSRLIGVQDVHRRQINAKWPPEALIVQRRPKSLELKDQTNDHKEHQSTTLCKKTFFNCFWFFTT
jgi:hypothetical protein